MSGLKNEKIQQIELINDRKNEKEEIFEVEIEEGEQKSNELKSPTFKISNGKIEKKRGINPRILWKIMHMKYTPRIEIRICKKCANALYYDKNKFTQKENGNIGICFEICEGCAKLNIQLKDFVSDWNEISTNFKK